MMKLLLFSLKKTLRTPIYWIFLLGLLLLPPLFYQVGRQTTPPPAAYFLADAADPDGALLAGHLADAGFLAYPSEESLRRDISLGRLEGGVVIPADLTARLSRGEYKKSLCFITSSTALLPDLWQNHTAAALLAVYSPYISADILKEADISEAEMKAAYQEMMTTGQLFHFEISTRDGILVPDVMRSRRFFLGAMGLLLFLASYFCIAAPLGESVEEMALRLGKGRAYRSLYVPGMLLRGLGLFLAAAGACLIAGESRYILPVLGTLSAMLFFLFLLGLLPGRKWKDLLIFFIALFSLALSPMYVDLSLLIPLAGKLRLLLPPVWLWLLAGML